MGRVVELLESLKRLAEAPAAASEVHYLGIFLTPQSQAKLLRAVPPKFPQKSADHITIAFAPTEEEIEKFRSKIGQRVVLTVTHTAANDRIQAVKVKDVQTKRGTPHITVSYGPGVPPHEANELVSREKGEPIQPWLKLQGVYDFFPRTIEV